MELNNETNEVNEKKNDDNKVLIDNAIDLYKTPIHVLISTKLYNFSGKYYKKIFDEAIKEEQNEKNNPQFNQNINMNNNNNNMNNNNNYINQNNNYNNINNSYQNNSNNNYSYQSSNLNTQPSSYYNSSSSSFNQQSYSRRQIQINKIIFKVNFQTRMGQELGVIGSLQELGNWNQNNVLRLKWTDGNNWVNEINFEFQSNFEYKFIMIINGRPQKYEDGGNRIFNLYDIKNMLENSGRAGDIIYLNNIRRTDIEYDYRDNSLKLISRWNEK
jgi:hypothetical protein